MGCADLDPDLVVDEATEDVLREQLGGPNVFVHAGVVAVAFPHVVDALDHPGHPSDAAFRQGYPQARELVEGGGEQQFGAGEERVRAVQGDGDAEVGVRRDARATTAPEVQAHRHVGVLEGGEHRVPVVAVEGGETCGVGRLDERDGPGALGRDAFDLGCGRVDVPVRDQPHGDHPVRCRGTPFVEDEVVPRRHAGVGESLVLGHEERRSGETGNEGKHIWAWIPSSSMSRSRAVMS